MGVWVGVYVSVWFSVKTGENVGEWVKDDCNTHIHPIYPTPSPNIAQPVRSYKILLSDCLTWV
jgi:hypothetical protein